MAQDGAELNDKLVTYIQDAHAMEQNVKRMLDSMIETTADPMIKQQLVHHREQTEHHEQLLNTRLDQLGVGTSALKEGLGIASSMAKGMADMVRSDKPGQNARDGYVTEHMEIAAYELLERLARRAGDPTTADVARQICADERAMADKIEKNWDRFVDLTIEEEIGTSPPA